PEDMPQEDAFLNKFRKLIMDHLTEEDFGVPQLCRLMGLGRTQLHNKIKALTGHSTTALVRTIRLHHARILLQTTDLNVSEVSYAVGIGNPAYFSRIYSDEFGEAPRETRQ
ncbi:MAG TPA: AraC family transcriptional regulator, partial [Saprospiraceae bacterium]|nr:AraC family transcriptional regulator [Saprospiraceae bacterium]